MLRREDWFKSPYSEGSWSLSPTPVPGHGHQQSRIAEHKGSGIRAYMKPGSKTAAVTAGEKSIWLAHERIASHLAYLLHMNVPPVLLAYHPDDSSLPVCFSMEAGSAVFDWCKVESDFNTDKTKELIKSFAPLIALEIWIQALDRKDVHVLYAEDDEGNSMGLFGIDYSLSMLYNRSWNEQNFTEPYHEKLPPSVQKHLSDRNWILEGVQRIQDLEWRKVEEMIEDIKEPFMDSIHITCCFHPDARKSQSWFLAILEFKEENSPLVFHKFWRISDNAIRFLDSSTQSVLLKGILLKFYDIIHSALKQPVKRDDVLSLLGKVVGCGNFSFSELQKMEQSLTEKEADNIKQSVETTDKLEEILVTA